jgi:Ala-tRNA(Pro) deacylase
MHKLCGVLYCFSRPYINDDSMEGAMPVQRLKEFLDRESVRYVVISHSPAFTAQEIAANAHIPGREMAKTVMVKIDGNIAMAVLPASRHVDFDEMEKVSGARRIELASEAEFRDLFPQCELGAMPPFGNLYNMPVYVALALTEDEDIAFNAGTHRELVRMKYKEYERLVKPTILKFSAT